MPNYCWMDEENATERSHLRQGREQMDHERVNVRAELGDDELVVVEGELFPPTTGVAVDIFCGALDPKFARSNYIRSHRNRDVLARGAIPCEAEPGEPDQHHCPGRGLRNRASDGEVETKSA